MECTHPPWPVKALGHAGRAFLKQPTSHCTEENAEAPEGGMVSPLRVLDKGSQESQDPGIQEGYTISLGLELKGVLSPARNRFCPPSSSPRHCMEWEEEKGRA